MQDLNQLESKQILEKEYKAKRYISWLLSLPKGKSLIKFIKNIVVPYITSNIQSGKQFSQIKYELDKSIVPYIKILKDSRYISLSNITNITNFISTVEEHLTRIRKVNEQDDGIQVVYQYNNGWNWSDVYGYVSLWRLGKLLQVPLGALGQDDYKRVSQEIIIILALYDDKNLPVMAIEISIADNIIQKIISFKDQGITSNQEKAYLLDFLIKNWVKYKDIELSKLLRHGICIIGKEVNENYKSIMNKYDLTGELLIYEEEDNNINDSQDG